jgi:hypothetical protein
MTPFQKIRLVFIITVAVIAGISGGWEVALGWILLVGLVLGFWVVISAAVDTAIYGAESRWEARRDDDVRNRPTDADYYPSDPTGPDDDEHPLIQIHRQRKELGRGKHL